MKFHTKIQLNGKTATGIEVPATVVESLGSSKRPAVHVTIKGYSYRTTVAPMGGVFMIPISGEHRAGAGIAAGDEVEVEVVPDNEPREVVVPPDFAAALDGDAEAKQIFNKLAYSHKLRHVLAIEQAKTAETRQRRIEKVLAMLHED